MRLCIHPEGYLNKIIAKPDVVFKPILVPSCPETPSLNPEISQQKNRQHPHAFASIFFPSSAILAFLASAALFSSSIILANCFSLASS